jgi:hypothetical protein
MANKPFQTESIGAVLEHSLKRLDLAARLDDYAIWPVWNDVVGATIARNAQPEKIRNGTLFVKVSSPVWMQQLQFMKDMIAGKLNQRLKAERVKNIFFMVGRIEPAADAPSEARAPAAAAAPVDDAFLQSIADPDMRAAFGRLLQSYSRRRTRS